MGALIAMRLACLLATSGLFASLACAATISYGYDEAGRLVQVSSSAGQAQYRYDIAGNLTSVNVPAAGTVVIADFSPNSGPVGTSVTITGAGFSSTASANTVRFNGVAATVTSASATGLTVTVPGGATSGLVSVTVAGSTGTSATDFTVSTDSMGTGPTVTNVNPLIAAVGSTVTVAGDHFGNQSSGVWVRVNGRNALVTSVTPTQITFTVPSNATTGYVAVGTPNGSAMQTALLFIPPAGLTASDISTTASLAADTSPLAVSVATGKKGLLAFTGVARQNLTLGFTAVSSSGSVAIKVMAPDGTVFNDCGSVSAPSGVCALPPLPAAGTYVLRIDPPSGAAASLSVNLSNDVAAELQVDGGAMPVTTTYPGQSTRYGFTATRDITMVDLPASTIGAAFVAVWDTAGVRYAAGNLSAGAQLKTTGLTAGRRYEVRVSPLTPLSGSVTLGVGLPDLVISGLAGSSVVANHDGSWTVPVTYTVTNGGKVTALSLWYDVGYLSTDAVLDDADQTATFFKTGGGPSVVLLPGASYTETRNFPVPASTATGAYNIIIRTNGRSANAPGGGQNTADGWLDEMDRSNNTAVQAITLGRPDLTISNVVVGTIAARGDGSWSIPISYTVTNVGAVTAQPGWYDMAYLSTDAVLSDADQSNAALYSHRGEWLAPGASTSYSGNFITNATTAPGSYTLFVKTDGRNSTYGGTNTDNGVMVEANEGNNVAAVAVVLGTATPPPVDSGGDADSPLPPWALWALGAALLGAMRRRQRSAI